MLQPTDISSPLLALYRRKPTSVDVYARELASIYDAYAKRGQAGGGVPVLGRDRVDRISPILSEAHKTPSSPATVARLIAQAVVTYWTLPPADFEPGVGTVVSITGVNVAQVSLANLFSVPNSSEAVVASRLASILDALTRTVLVSYTAPVPAGPFPMS